MGSKAVVRFLQAARVLAVGSMEACWQGQAQLGDGAAYMYRLQAPLMQLVRR